MYSRAVFVYANFIHVNFLWLVIRYSTHVYLYISIYGNQIGLKGKIFFQLNWRFLVYDLLTS